MATVVAATVVPGREKESPRERIIASIGGSKKEDKFIGTRNGSWRSRLSMPIRLERPGAAPNNRFINEHYVHFVRSNGIYIHIRHSK